MLALVAITIFIQNDLSLYQLILIRQLINLSQQLIANLLLQLNIFILNLR
jgi:hypothetical protein